MGVGGEFHLPTPEGTVDLRVLGLLPERTLPGNEEVLVTLFEAQRLFDLPQRINTIEINFDTTVETQRQSIQHTIETTLGEDYTLGGLASGSEMLGSIRTGQMAFNIFGFLALVMGGFIIFNTFRTIVAERRHDIGMLRAVGASRRMVIGLVLMEGLVQGVVGSLAGMLLGYLGGSLLLSSMAPVLEQYIHLEMAAPVVQPGLIVLTLVLGIGVTLVAGLLPALQASRVTPLEALRPGVVEEGRGRRWRGTVVGIVLILLAGLCLLSGNISLTGLGGLFFLVGLVLVGPALVAPLTAAFGILIERSFARDGTGSLARSNMNRQPSRSAITASATMVGIAVIVGVGGMVWSITGGFLGVLERSLGSDYLFMPPSVGLWGSDVGAKSGLADSLHSVPGVGVVSSLRYAAATVNGKSVALLGIDPVAYPKVASLTFQQGDSATAYTDLAEGRSIIINGIVASQLEVGVGSEVSIASPSGHKPYRVVAVAGDYLNAKIMTGYISHDNMERDFHKTEDIFLQVNLAPGADPIKVEPRLAKVLEDYPQFKLISGKAYFDQNRQMFNAIFSIYFVLLGVLVAPSLIAPLEHAGHRRDRAHARDRHAARHRRSTASGAADGTGRIAPPGRHRHLTRAPGRALPRLCDGFRVAGKRIPSRVRLPLRRLDCGRGDRPALRGVGGPSPGAPGGAARHRACLALRVAGFELAAFRPCAPTASRSSRREVTRAAHGQAVGVASSHRMTATGLHGKSRGRAAGLGNRPQGQESIATTVPERLCGLRGTT